MGKGKLGRGGEPGPGKRLENTDALSTICWMCWRPGYVTGESKWGHGTTILGTKLHPLAARV